MGLLDDLANPEKLQGTAKVRCTVCLLLKALDSKESDKLSMVIDDPNVNKTQVARILNDNGYKIAANAITRHARRECLRS